MLKHASNFKFYLQLMEIKTLLTFTKKKKAIQYFFKAYLETEKNEQAISKKNYLNIFTYKREKKKKRIARKQFSTHTFQIFFLLHRASCFIFFVMYSYPCSQFYIDLYREIGYLNVYY